VSVLVGVGYDSHRLVPDRPLRLGGVEIAEAEQGLAGHSDADVLAHAVIDSLLGAAGLGDIGQHFPDTDPRYAGADSMVLLAQVRALLGDEGLSVTNLDATVVCERPRLGPHRDAMRRGLAAAAGLSPRRVNVKFTTNEGMGWLGRGEGVAALAVAALERDS
jgi:2-C-methyl-D-erythritol 2,4-cyclodiphosphate synthase